MNKRIMISLLIGTLLLSPWTVADDGDDGESFWSWMGNFSRTKEIKPVNNALYQEECGACHFAYQPGLLPTRSWEKLLSNEALADHFGDSAELDAEDLSRLRDYVLPNAADKSYYKRSRKIDYATREGEAPLRITEVSYIRRKHHDIPEKLIKENPQVVSLINCNACHRSAEQGIFDDDSVNIPNYGSWED